MIRVVGLDPTKVRPIPNGVDTVTFGPGAAPPELRERLKLPVEGVVVGSIGRFELVKAYHRLIEAVASLRDRGGPRVYLVLCGDGSERATLEDLAASKGMADRVRMPGWVDDPAAYYRLFDVFALASLSEGASVSLLEAMASGVAPVVGVNRALPGAGARRLRDTVRSAGGLHRRSGTGRDGRRSAGTTGASGPLQSRRSFRSGPHA
jgi:glycosyltransferase involved in cell wall biosynthesis